MVLLGWLPSLRISCWNAVDSCCQMVARSAVDGIDQSSWSIKNALAGLGGLHLKCANSKVLY